MMVIVTVMKALLMVTMVAVMLEMSMMIIAVVFILNLDAVKKSLRSSMSILFIASTAV